MLPDMPYAGITVQACLKIVVFHFLVVITYEKQLNYVKLRICLAADTQYLWRVPSLALTRLKYYITILKQEHYETSIINPSAGIDNSRIGELQEGQASFRSQRPQHNSCCCGNIGWGTIAARSQDESGECFGPR